MIVAVVEDFRGSIYGRGPGRDGVAPLGGRKPPDGGRLCRHVRRVPDAAGRRLFARNVRVRSRKVGARLPRPL